MERSIHDALCVVKRVLESGSVVCGGGAVEAALSVYLENFATSLVNFLFVCFFTLGSARVLEDGIIINIKGKIRNFLFMNV